MAESRQVPYVTKRLGDAANWLAAQGVIRIPASLNVPADLIRAVENYGAFLQNLLGQAIAPSAAGTVICDPAVRTGFTFGPFLP